MVATARDLALYTTALRDGQLLEPERIEFLMEWFPVGGRVQVGHNVFRIEFPDGLARIGHNGSVLGFTGSIYWVEGADIVVAVVSNVGTMHSGNVPGSWSMACATEFVELAMKVAEGG